MSNLVTLATPNADGVLGWFGETTAVASVLVLLAILAGRLRWRGRALSPATRHMLWLVVLVKLMTPPLLHWPGSVRSAVLGVSFLEPQAPALPDVPILTTDPTDLDISYSDLSRGDGEKGDIANDRRADWARIEGPRVDDALCLPSFPVRIGIALAWLAGSIVIGVGQVRRIVRFRALMGAAIPAPPWLIAEAQRVGERLRVHVPSIRVVPFLGTPVLWCLGRPVLLVPGDLLKSLESERWRAILAHELAHLRRGDPWVCRLEALADLVWWWNPLYWLTRRRIDAEAELACDAWVLWALPDDRLSYAESLVQICTDLIPARSLAPALGVAGTGQSFKRRLTMILFDRVNCRVSPRGILAAGLLGLLALPSWTLAEPESGEDSKPAAAASKSLTDQAASQLVNQAINTAIDIATDVVTEVQEVASAIQKPDREDEDQEITEDKAAKRRAEEDVKARMEAAKARMEEAKARAAEARRRNARTLERARRENLDEKFVESDFEKKLEALGEKIGKDLEKKFGPGSDFERKMKSLEQEIEKKLGPGSDFEKKLKALDKEVAKAGRQFPNLIVPAPMYKNGGPLPRSGRRLQAPAEPRAPESPESPEASPAPARRPQAPAEVRARRIKNLEVQIKVHESQLEMLKKQLKRLQDEVQDRGEDG
jgi:beta-lactamase regulating signal transducer with metallopeptidase domain